MPRVRREVDREVRWEVDREVLGSAPESLRMHQWWRRQHLEMRGLRNACVSFSTDLLILPLS